MNMTCPGEKPKLLYVDDERANLTAFRVLLRDRYNVLTAENADDAYELLREHDIPLVVSDQRMPGMTGTELLAKVATDFPDCARMILTGYTDIDAVIEGINRSQIYYYFKKPWNESEVRLTLENALEYVTTRRCLVDSERRFRSTFEQAGVGIAHINDDGTIMRANSKLQDFLCVAEAELIGKPISTWFDGIGSAELIAIATGSEEIITLEAAYVAPDGDRWSRAALTASKQGKGGGADYLIVVVDDLTERKQADAERNQLEERLNQSQKLEAIGSLAGGIAHDFNNLLTPIIIYAEMIAQKCANDDSIKNKAQGITKAALSAKQLTGQLLSFGRKQMLEMKPYDLNEVVGSFLDILRRTIRENIEIIINLDPNTLYVMADRGQLVQIILNLVINAQDAIEANGTVRIETTEVFMDGEIARVHPGMIPGRYALLVVTDSGIGMDEETLSHIFEPFYTTKQIGHGTGLGLATVYGIIKQHDGFVDVSSRHESGTVFKVYLPLQVPEKQVEDPDKVALDARRCNGTILVVDDNDMVREMLAEVLMEAGYTIHAASSPDMALKIAKKSVGQISLLLTDIVMPGMNGQELYEQISAFSPDIKVIYISGYASKVTVHGGFLEEGVNFLPKPFTSEALLERIQKLI